MIRSNKKYSYIPQKEPSKFPVVCMKIMENVLSLLYPDTCPVCGRITEEGICQECREKLQYIDEPRCMRCGKPLEDETREYCYDCEHHRHFYERGYSLWVHKDAVKYSVYQFKFHNRRIYGSFFANELLSRYGKSIIRWKISLIIPIPLSRKKQKKRGYNQAELIAVSLGRAMHIPVCTNGLKRVKDTKPQKQLSMRERRKNLKDAFRWEKALLEGENILLIDDIYTTGNTIDFAAIELKKAGASKVYFLTISIGQGS